MSRLGIFYVGAHRPYWLWSGEIPSDVPLFVSHRQLSKVRQLKPATVARWALDSGGFTELQRYGTWTVSPEDYVQAVRRYRDEIGSLEWAAPQDWMCEEVIRKGGTFGGRHFAGTGLTVDEHLTRTVENFIELRTLWGDDDSCPFRPVIQGDDLASYLRCLHLYRDAGVDLTSYETVGLGSVCRRQAEDEIGEIVNALLLDEPRLRLHGFGVKLRGIQKYGHLLTSADSMAWSYDARRSKALSGCHHRTCANCPRFLLDWREKALRQVSDQPFLLQTVLF